jgi:integrase/recombinase XerD
MTVKISNTLIKISLMKNKENARVLRKYYQYLKENDTGERHQNNALLVMVALDHFLQTQQVKNFAQIKTREPIVGFLEHKYVNGEWVKRESDPEGKYVTTWNSYVGLLRIFYRWLHNKRKERIDWKTPKWFKIKNKRAVGGRRSPYSRSQVWQQDELLNIVQYEPVLRNKLILTLLWDLDARPHEITALRMGDIRFHDNYAEGLIPYNTKTGGGPILLSSSFPYARDWVNEHHPNKNDPSAPFIVSLRNGAPLNPDTIWIVLETLRERIKRLVETESVTGEEKQKLEYLLRAKKWSPYCFRHSAIWIDLNRLPPGAVEKKVRWVPGSTQSRRYGKNIMDDDLKNKILEMSGKQT